MSDSKAPQRPVVLLCWGYHRPGWNESLEKLSGFFHYHYLFFFSPRLARGQSPKAPVHFWTDFRSPQELISLVRPACVVFMGLDGLQTIALNIVARRAKVPTLFLQHGVLLPLGEIAALDSAQAKGEPFFRLTRAEKIHQALFFFRSIGLKEVGVLSFAARWLFMRSRIGTQLALAKSQTLHRRADTYAVFTRSGAESLLRERDGVESSQIVEIGNPSFDEYFTARESVWSQNEIYELLIDQPISGAPELPLAIKTPEEVVEFHERLAGFCQRRGAKLVVKLHPYSHGGGLRAVSNNIRYVTEVSDLPGLLGSSRAVYGYYSSLLLPAIVLKPCCLFDIGVENSLQIAAKTHQVAQIVPFEGLPPEDFHLSLKPKSGLHAFTEEYLFRSDGRSLDRLRELMLAMADPARRGGTL